jgi:hypothetical protein
VASVCRLTQLEIHTGMNDQGIFFDFSTLQQLDAAIHSSRIDWATFDLKKSIPSRDGFLASTNHFVKPEWGLANPPGDPNNTKLRRNNLLGLGEKYNGTKENEESDIRSNFENL